MPSFPTSSGPGTNEHAPEDHLRDSRKGGSRLRRFLTGTLAVLTAGVILQAILAGQFIAGLADLRELHGVVGMSLFPISLVAAVVAVIGRRRGVVRRGVMMGALVLPIVVAIQTPLGLAGVSIATAVHVPLGVGLFGGTVVLTHVQSGGALIGSSTSVVVSLLTDQHVGSS